jgi:Lysine methyltransferase
MPPCYSFSQKAPNRARNVLLQYADPWHPVQCEFEGHSLIIHQTPDDISWPGGALWDCGVLLSEFILGVAGMETLTLRCTLDVEGLPLNVSPTENDVHTTTQLATRLKQWTNSQSSTWKNQLEEVLLRRPNLRILELGCGVGMSGLVAAVALRAKTCILTDLTEVVDNITQKNVTENTQPSHTNHQYRTIPHSKGECTVVATPFCWGNPEQGEHVLRLLQEELPPSTAPLHSYPDIILLADVAYEHRPGAPSHFTAQAIRNFDLLVQSLQQMMPPSQTPQTLLVFGIRLRMVGSIELLHLLQRHFTPVLKEHIPAEVLDPALLGFEHHMTVHIFTNSESPT